MNDITPLLHDKGYSATRVRKEIFAILYEQGPMTLRQLTRATVNSIDRASVYRVVDLFERIGFVRRINQGWKSSFEVSDQFTHHHHHITCSECGVIQDLVFQSQVEQLLERTIANTGFIKIQHELEAIGICQKCQKSRSPGKTGAQRKPHTSTTKLKL